MSRTFKGRVVLSGAVKGEAAVSRQGGVGREIWT